MSGEAVAANPRGLAAECLERLSAGLGEAGLHCARAAGVVEAGQGPIVDAVLGELADGELDQLGDLVRSAADAVRAVRKGGVK